MKRVAKRLHPQAYDALQDALTHYYWYKPDLAAFLRTAFSEEPSLLGGVELLTSTKRESARVITERLRAREDQLRDFILRLLVTLAEFDDAFPYLRRLDDGEAKVAAAVAAPRCHGRPAFRARRFGRQA